VSSWISANARVTFRHGVSHTQPEEQRVPLVADRRVDVGNRSRPR